MDGSREPKQPQIDELNELKTQLSKLMSDISERMAAESALKLLVEVTAAASEAPDVTSCAKKCLETICRLRGWEVGQAWFPSEDDAELVCSEEAYFACIAVPTFRQVSLESRFKRGTGLPGRIWDCGGPVGIYDVTEDSNFPRGPYAKNEGLKAAFGFPVSHADKCYAILEFFTRELPPPDVYFLDAVEKLGRHLSIVFEQKRWQRELSQSRKQLERKVAERTRELEEANIFFSLSVDLFCIGSLDGTILRVNQAFERTLGFSPDEYEGAHQSKFTHPDDMERVGREMEKLQEGQEVLSFEVRCLCKDGSHKWLLWSARPFPEKGIYYAIGHDIDARKQAEEELMESERMHTQILDAVSDLILSKDPQSRIVYANKAFRAFYGMTMEELNGIIDAPFNEPGYTEQYLADDAYVFETGHTRNIPQEPVTRHDGKVVHFNTIKSPIFGADGTVVRSVGVSRDITGHLEAQDRISKLNEDLEIRVNELASINRELESLTHKLEVSRDQALEASKLKSEFVANISHEVRTPITGVLGMTELLLDGVLTDEQSSLAKAIKDSAQSLLTIINDILDFSKMEAGKIEVEVIDFSPVSLVEGCAELVATTAREKKLSLLSYVDPQTPPLLKGDPVRLRQILLNLASNAVKFTERGEVVLETLVESRDENSVILRFVVSETGIGLSESARKRLFQPFVQADGSTTRKFGGTGLGLSICRHLVDILGGDIGVDSTEGRGSTFWFTVPLVASDASELTSASFFAASGADLRELRILIASDSPTARSIVSRYLDAAGIHNETASSARDVMKQLRGRDGLDQSFDVVVIDLAGSGTDSYTLARTIRLDANLNAVRLVVLTPTEEKSKSNELVKEGFSVFLTKPVRQVQLMEAIAKVMGRTSWGPRHPAPHAVSDPIAGEASLSVPTTNDCIILVAEDNQVLKELAVLQLKKLGFPAQSVANGKEVVEAMAGTSFALVLMDCQMPHMDGFEATLAIRKNESVTGLHIPIVAMTASAMQGDREHCLTSGMDDYLAKPVTLEQLRAVLTRWLPQHCVSAPPSSRATDTSDGQREIDSSGAIDIEGLFAMYGGEALKEILQLFIRETQHLFGEAQFAIKREDSRTLANVAHQLKGLSAVMSAAEMEDISRELETAGKESNWQLALASYEALENCFDRLSSTIGRCL